MIRPIDSLSRGCLASLFLYGGSRAVRDPSAVAADAEFVTGPLAAALPWFPPTKFVVRANGICQVVAAGALATGKTPRLAALILAASLIPTTIAGHRFWEQTDPAARNRVRIEFLSNMSILGGLISTFLSAQPPGADLRCSGRPAAGTAGPGACAPARRRGR